MLEIEKIKEAVKKQTLASVYLWYGEDRYLLQEALKIVKQAYLLEDPSGSSIEMVSARELFPSVIVERANTFSFFQKRLIIIENVMYFQDGQTAELEPFYAYLANPNPDTCLIFVAESVHKGRKLYKAIAQSGEIIEFIPPKRTQDWRIWLKNELKARGKAMPSEAEILFLEWGGHQVGILVQELDKLAAFVGEKKNITVEDIKAVTIRTAEVTVFELLDAVAARSAKKALHKLSEVLREEHPLKVLTLLVRQVRLLLGAQAWRNRGGNGAELASALGIRPYEAQKIWQQSAKLSFESLAKAMNECLKTELALKSSGGNPGFLLEILIIKLAAQKNPL